MKHLRKPLPRLLSILSGIFVAASVVSNPCDASDGSNNVHATAALLLGAPQARTAANRVTNTIYAQGTYAQMSGQTYFALVGGTTSTGTATNGLGDSTDGTVTWRRCLPRDRKGFVIVNASTNLIWLSDRAFTGASGVQLAANGGAWTVEGSGTPQGTIWCRAALTNSPVLTFEW